MVEEDPLLGEARAAAALRVPGVWHRKPAHPCDGIGLLPRYADS
jgi:hypothetical protein